MPKISRSSKQGSNKRKQNIEAKATCDADQMNSSALKKMISSFKPIEPNHTVQTAKPVKLEDNASFDDADIQFDQELEMCNIDAEHEPKKTDIDWKAVKAEVEAREELRDRIKLDGDGGQCSISLKKYLAALVKPAFTHTSHHIAPKGNLNLLTPGDAFKSVMPVETGMV